MKFGWTEFRRPFHLFGVGGAFFRGKLVKSFTWLLSGHTEHYYVCWFQCFYLSSSLWNLLLDVTLCAVTCNKIDCSNEWIFYLLVYTKHIHTKQTIFCWNRCFDSHVESCEKNNSQSIIMKKKNKYTVCDAKTWVTFVRIVCENVFDIHYYVLQHFLVFNAIREKNIT